MNAQAPKLIVPQAVSNANPNSRFWTWLGIFVAVFGAAQSQIAAIYPKYAPFVMLAGAILAAFNERALGGLSIAQDQVKSMSESQTTPAVAAVITDTVDGGNSAVVNDAILEKEGEVFHRKENK